MIGVKGTRTQARNADPAERYAFKVIDKGSKGLVAFSLFLMGLVVYLKSVFPSVADPNEAGSAGGGERQGEAQPSMAPGQAADLRSEGAAPNAMDAAEDGSGGAGRGSVAPMAVAVAPAEAPPEIDHPEANSQPSLIGVGPSPGVVVHANDNSNPREAGPAAPDSAGHSDPRQGGGEVEAPDPVDPDPPEDEPPEESEDDPCENGEPSSGNRAPRLAGPVYLRDISGGAILAIALDDLLRNAVDPDGDTLVVRDVTVSAGELRPAAGAWMFRADPQMLGPVTITYRISDGEHSVQQTAHFRIVSPAIQGTDGPDIILGSAVADEIDGGDGDDNIDAGAGDDVVQGGAGDDHVVAGSGHDTIFGGAGDDILFGGGGNDRISGGSGNDRLFGEDGDDILFGEAGEDVLEGGRDDDLLFGGSGNDTIDGGSGRDLVDGGDGNDKLSDGAGEDVVLGGAGNDHVLAACDRADDLYDGGDGCDTLDYSATSAGVLIDTVSGIARGVEIGVDTISGFETLRGGSGDDHFIVGDASVVLVGGAGENLFEFGASTSVVEAPARSHEILDFKVGDRIRMSKYDLFEEVVDELDDLFEEVYGEDLEDDQVPIRFRHDWVDEMQRTIIEADFNRDEIYETTITLTGHHLFVVMENV